MSLQVWLPLIKNNNNQGLSSVQPTIQGTFSKATNGKLGICFGFGTESGYLDIPVTDVRNISGSCSVSFWINIQSFNTNYTTVFSMNRNSAAWADEIFTFQRNNNGSNYTFHISDGTNHTTANCVTGTLTTGTWYHFVLVADTENDEMRIYQDGSLVTTYATTITPNFAVVNNFRIGVSQTTYQGHFLMNDFRLYDEVLSLKSIKELSKGLVLHYPLNRGGFGGDNLLRGSYDLIKGTGSYDTATYRDSGAGTTYNQTMPSGAPFNKGVYMTYTGSRVGFCQDSVPITAGTLTQTAWIKAPAGGTISLQPYWWSGASGFNVNFTTNGKWQKLVATVDTNTKTQPMSIGYVYYTGKTSGDICYVCGLKVEYGYESTPWIPNSADSLYSAMGLNSNIEYDVSGYGNHLTSSAAHTYSSDTPRYNLCTVFSNASYNAYTASSKNVGLGGRNSEFTISAWVYAESWVDDYPAVIWIGPASTNQSVSLIVNNGKLDLDFWNNRYVASTAMSANAWHHVAATKTPGAINTTCKLYVDGALVAGSSSAAVSPNIASSGNIILGSLNDTANRRWNGMISDVRVYTTALSADDILALYHTPTSIANNGTLLTQGEISEV